MIANDHELRQILNCLDWTICITGPKSGGGSYNDGKTKRNLIKAGLFGISNDYNRGHMEGYKKGVDDAATAILTGVNKLKK